MERIYGGIPIFPTNAAVEAKLLYASNLSLYVGNQINDSPKTRFDILFDIDIERRIEWYITFSKRAYYILYIYIYI